MLAAGAIPGIQVRQFDTQEGRLKRVQSTIEAPHDMVIFFALPIIAQNPQSFRDPLVTCDHHTAVAESAQIFPGMKTKRSRVS